VTDLPAASRAVRLADGRRLAFRDVGPRGGTPVVYLHGAIGSPLQCGGPLAAAIEDLRIRLLLPQRPGFGASDPHRGRTLLDFAGDVDQLADALGLDRFAVVGVSAGGPYAVACAHRLAGRVPVAAAVSSLSPLCAPADVPGLPTRIRLALRAIAGAPALATRVGDAAVGFVARHPALLLRAMAAGAPSADRSHLADDATAATAVDAFLAATAGGVAGLIEDHLLTSRPWGLPLGEVAGEVHVWHGMGDAFVPVEHALQLVAALPRCRTFLDPEEGHFFFRRRVRDILAELVAGPAPVPSASP
jgi:pimeloyl-ACP methyl ester carboxylesterase